MGASCELGSAVVLLDSSACLLAIVGALKPFVSASRLNDFRAGGRSCSRFTRPFVDPLDHSQIGDGVPGEQHCTATKPRSASTAFAAH